MPKKVNQPLTGPNRDNLEAWLADGGMQKLRNYAQGLAYKYAEPDVLMQETLERAFRATSWQKYDPTKGDIFLQLKFIMYRENLRNGRDYQFQPHGDVIEENTVHVSEERDTHVRLDLEAAISSLPPRDRDLFDRVYVKGMTYTEAGEPYGLSKQRVGQIVTAARSIVRKQLRAYEGNYGKRVRGSKSPAKSLSDAA